MSALARLYLDCGWTVSGSDRASGEQVQLLRQRGVEILPELEQASLDEIALVVHSPAVPMSDPALQAARRRGIPVWNRTRALTSLIAGREVISVAGSHGKSTTTAMLAVILNAAGFAPGHMVGGVSDALDGANGRWGAGPLMVTETCEAFRALDLWHPQHCLLTNVDDEHSEQYANLSALQSAFADLVTRVPEDGSVVLCGDDPFLSGLAARLGERVLTYGIGRTNRVHASQVTMTPEGCVFDLMVEDVVLGRGSLQVPGLHNLRNALGALAMAVSLGIDPEQAFSALSGFHPVRRRWQEVGVAHGVKVFDDFAHHPTEIEATLALARSVAGSGRVHAVLQPQMVSRVRRLADDFAAALALADQIWTLPLDPAGETGDPTAAEAVLQRALGLIPRPVSALSDAGAAAAALRQAVRPGDLIVCMGPAMAREAARAITEGLAAITALPSFHLPAHPSARPAADPGALLYDRFDTHAAKQPAALCAVSETEEWTYARMSDEAGRIAAALAVRGIGPGDIVAVTMRKSPAFIASLLGIAKAGAAFATIDPRMTRAGMGRILRIAGARLTLTDDPWQAAETGFDAPLTLSDLLAGAPASAPLRRAAPDDLAYAIFTSGSTGVPRLVGVEHRHTVAYFDRILGTVFIREDYVLMPTTSSISFDASLHQVFCTLSLGGTLLVVEDVAALSRSAHFDRITLLGGPPSTLRAFLENNALPASVRTVNLGGEPVPPEFLDRLRKSPGLRRVWNLYGPAEATMTAFAAPMLELMADGVAGDTAGRTIGRPFPGVLARVIGEDSTEVAAGEVGTLLIGGPTVGRGYLGMPGLTAERFLADPDQPGLRWYRTGDIVCEQPDGNFQFLGREDDQVKINGARIELGEVRSAVMGCPGVRDAAVLALPSASGRNRLAAFVVFDRQTDVAFLREWLRRHHAAILTPHRIISLPALPLQINGKLDRQALMAIAASDDTTPMGGGVPDAGDEVLTIWRRILQRDDLTVDDDFRSSGGDSLMAMETIMAVEAQFDIRLADEALDTLTTPAAMAEAVALAVARRRPASDDKGDDILHKQRMYVAAWAGSAARPDALVRTLNPAADPGLFWVFQGSAEFAALATALGPRIALHGMRSGHLIMAYTPETIDLLAEAYATEIIALQPEGAISIGGNCQGAVIARAIAFALRRRGRKISHLILMEMARFWQYDAPVDLVYGADSALNPFRGGTDPGADLAAAYPQGFSPHFIRGAHGAFFEPQNVPSLAGVLRGLLANSGTTA